MLGIVFNWDALAQVIMNSLPLPPEEKEISRALNLDDAGLILAGSQDQILHGKIEFAEREMLFQQKKGYLPIQYKGSPCCAAHALSSRFETYSTGWHSVIIQPRMDS